MGNFIDLSIRKIEIKNPKEDLKQILKLQQEVNEGLSVEEYYYPTNEKTIQECLMKDHVLLGVYDQDKLIAVSFAFEGGLFFGKPLTDWMKIEGNKIMCHEFVVVDKEYRGNGLQQRFMSATVREARAMGYDTIWCCAHPDNMASVKSILKAGYSLADTFTVDGWPRNVYVRRTKEITGEKHEN